MRSIAFRCQEAYQLSGMAGEAGQAEPASGDGTRAGGHLRRMQAPGVMQVQRAAADVYLGAACCPTIDHSRLFEAKTAKGDGGVSLRAFAEKAKCDSCPTAGGGGAWRAWRSWGDHWGNFWGFGGTGVWRGGNRKQGGTGSQMEVGRNAGCGTSMGRGGEG
ncbi:hypothetical protein EJ06DRAFT_292290 [Trichodelitschia bisporula]|uniref:Uncharacterized protein n=1 Tax=Trichodelitschia bisporula TaxID=703511 RepID=A0A6G1I663_9PEZI|nr:hypothetical protein EJ06DRAFT_292290 [Trichodelitschia bisporula]